MKSSVVGIVFSIFLVVLLLVITPMYYISIVQWARSENEMMSEVSELIDKVIDTKILTTDMIADFNLSLAAKPLNYRATIARESMVVNPDPNNLGQTYSTYVITDNISEWKQGDIITITVEMIGESMFTTISSRILGLCTNKDTFTLAGRVR